MRIWFLLFFALLLIGVAYTFWRTWQILPCSTPWKIAVLVAMTLCLFVFFANFGIWTLDKLPMPVATTAYHIGNSSMFVLLYVVMLFLLLDIGRWVHVVPADFLRHSIKGTLSVLFIIVGLFTYGYVHYRDKVRQPLTLTTSKKLESPLKIVMLSDLHLGYHNQIAEFNRWVDLINQEHPDLILIGGDIIDGHMRPLIEQNMAQSFRNLKAPVVACLGNHEYYTGGSAALKFYEDAGIHLLVDSAMTLKGVNIIGRDDRTNAGRKSLEQLLDGIDTTRYTILLDHQPYHLEQAEQNAIDFQLSGHTHYGQVWPISWIEDAVYEDAYGPLQKGNTRYFVTSGIGIWGGKFRIGTRSEYLVAELKN